MLQCVEYTVFFCNTSCILNLNHTKRDEGEFQKKKNALTRVIYHLQNTPKFFTIRSLNNDLNFTAKTFKIQNGPSIMKFKQSKVFELNVNNLEGVLPHTSAAPKNFW